LCARYLGGAVAGSASIDGVSAVKMPASDNSQWINFAGVAITDIASDEYGIVQSWGYSENVSLSAETNLTIGIYGGPAGTILRSSPVAGQLTSKGSALHALSAHFTGMFRFGILVMFQVVFLRVNVGLERFN